MQPENKTVVDARTDKSIPLNLNTPTIELQDPIALAAEQEPDLKKGLEFKVTSRSRAQKITKFLFGVLARVWIRRPVDTGTDLEPDVIFGVAVGTEKGEKKKVLGEGKDFTEALGLSVHDYLMGGKDYETTLKRFRDLSQFCDVRVFVQDALRQFPEEYKRLLEKYKTSPEIIPLLAASGLLGEKKSKPRA